MTPVLMTATLAVAASALVAGTPAEEKGTKYGAGVTLEAGVTVADLLASPDRYLGQTVRVDGIVRSVCQNMGCWMQIADAEQGPGIQFKVDDGVIVFPKDGKGRRASAQGVFERMPAQEEHAEHADHAAPEASTPTAQPEAATVEPPKYRVKATGAIVY